MQKPLIYEHSPTIFDESYLSIFQLVGCLE